MNNKHIPIIQTYEENERLKEELFTATADVQHFRTNFQRTKELLDREVQDVLDEYLRLKMDEETMLERNKEFLALKQENIDLFGQLETSERNLADEVKAFEKQLREYEAKIAQLEADQLSSRRSVRLSLSDLDKTGVLEALMKRKDPDQTLFGPEDQEEIQIQWQLHENQLKIAELESKLKETEEELDRLKSTGKEPTMVQTFAPDDCKSAVEQSHLSYIDRLEAQLKEEKRISERTQTLLMNYMKQCNQLEVQIANLESGHNVSSCEGKTLSELREKIQTISGELVELRDENKELREKCAQLLGLEHNVSQSILMEQSPTEDDIMNLRSEMEKGMQRSAELLRNAEELLGAVKEDPSLVDEIAPAESGETFDVVPVADRSAARGVTFAPDVTDNEQLSNSVMCFMNATNNISIDINTAKDKIATARSALVKMFNRLKSSAALFKEVLETQGVNNSLASQIQKMQIAFNTSMNEEEQIHSIFADAEKELTSLSINMSVLEQSVNMSMLMDMSRRMTVGGGILSSEQLRQSIRMFPLESSSPASTANSQEVESLKSEIVSLKEQIDYVISEKRQVEQTLDTVKVQCEDLKSTHERQIAGLEEATSTYIEKIAQLEQETLTLQHSLTTLQDASNVSAHFEQKVAEYEECLRESNKEKVEFLHAMENFEQQKEDMEAELLEMSTQLRRVEEELANKEQLRLELDEMLKTEREKKSTLVREKEEQAEVLRHEYEEKEREMFEKLEKELTSVEELQRELVESRNAEEELKNVIADRDFELNDLTRQLSQQEELAQTLSSDIQKLQEELDAMTLKAKKVAKSSSVQSTPVKKPETLSRHTTTDDNQKEVLDQLEEQVAVLTEQLAAAEYEKKFVIGNLVTLQDELEKLTERQLKHKIPDTPTEVDVAGITKACEEMSRQLASETKLRHKMAADLRSINDLREKQLKKEQENVPPSVNVSRTSTNGPSSSKPDTSINEGKKYVDHTRQFLRDMTHQVHSILQKAKTSANMDDAARKKLMEANIADLRTLRNTLYSKAMDFKNTDLKSIESKTKEELLNMIAELLDEKKTLLKEKSLKSLVPKIENEVSGIAKVMKDVTQVVGTSSRTTRN